MITVFKFDPSTIYSDGLQEKVAFFTKKNKSFLPDGLCVKIPSWSNDYFLARISKTIYSIDDDVLTCFIVLTDHHADHVFNDYDIEGLIENGWSYV